MSDLADLLTHPAARAALARRDIAAVFGTLRAAGVSQARIARATGQRQSDVSAVLAGRRVQSIIVLERIADGLGVPRGWMGLAHAPGLVTEPADDAETEDERSVNLLRHAATVLFGAPIFGPAGPIRSGHAPTPVPDRIGEADLRWLTATTVRLGRLSDNSGGVSMSDALTAHASTCEALLSADMREPVRRRLLVVLADLHVAAGWAAGDAGLRDRARQHYARSMSCAGAGGDHVRVILNLHGEGRSELQFGQPDAALKLFQLGAGIAPTELTRAMLEHDCAWALARIGLKEEALGALRRARDAHQRAHDEPGPWKHFVITTPHVEGCTQLALGQFESAVHSLTAAVDGTDHAVRCSTLNLGELATAQLRAGELRAGLHTAAQVVGKARALRSVWVRDRLAPLQQAAAARRESACRDLAHELAALRGAA